MSTYIVAIDDLFRVEAESIDEAKQTVLDNLGTDPFIAHDARVVEAEE